MAYADELSAISRQPITLVILTMDYCSNTFGVVPCTATGTQCYNTFPTCKDLQNYAKTTKDYKFCMIDNVPFKAGERPYLVSVKYLATEIKTSFTIPGKVTITFTDEPDTDVGIDPYVTSRTSVQGTFWNKFLARNTNYKGRLITIKEGFAGLAEVDYQTKFIGLLDNIKISKNAVSVDCIDFIKSLANYKLPPKISIRTHGSINETATAIGLSTHSTSDLSTAGGYVRIGDEIIQYSGMNTATNELMGCSRGQKGSAAETHADDSAIQPCLVLGPANPYAIMTQILSCYVSTQYIDSTAFTRLQDWPRADIQRYTFLSDPVKAEDLYFELVDECNCKSWYSEDQKITISKNINVDPSRVYTTVSEYESILEDSLSVDLNSTSQISRCYLYWDKTLFGKDKDSTSYSKIDVAIDVDIESTLNYGEQNPKYIYSRWLRTTGVSDVPEETRARYARNLVTRQVQYFRDPQKIVTCSVDRKDEAVKTGSFVKLTSTDIPSVDGNGAVIRSYQVVKKDIQDQEKIKLSLQEMPARKLCIIAPASVVTEPYSSATQAQKEVYGFIATSSLSNKMSDGTDGYYIY